MRFLPFVMLMAVLTGCGPKMMTPDAGPDTSCGLDCAAQTRYGLTLDTCFEYSTDNSTAQTPPSLGVWVQRQMTADGLFELEGGVKSLVVEYRQGGQTVGTDYLTIKNSELYLLRRIAGGQSVTYKTDQAITGVKWLTMNTASGENFSTSSTAFLSRDNSSTATAYRVTTDVPTGAEKKSPLMMTSDAAFKILFGETPDHGSDPRRVFVPDVGFTLIASPFNLLGGSPTPHYLQKIRTVTVGGAGDPCSLGAP